MHCFFQTDERYYIILIFFVDVPESQTGRHGLQRSHKKLFLQQEVPDKSLFSKILEQWMGLAHIQVEQMGKVQ